MGSAVTGRLKRGRAMLSLTFSVNNLGCSVGASSSGEGRHSSEFLSCNRAWGYFKSE